MWLGIIGHQSQFLPAISAQQQSTGSRIDVRGSIARGALKYRALRLPIGFERSLSFVDAAPVVGCAESFLFAFDQRLDRAVEPATSIEEAFSHRGAADSVAGRRLTCGHVIIENEPVVPCQQWFMGGTYGKWHDQHPVPAAFARQCNGFGISGEREPNSFQYGYAGEQ